MHVRDAVVAALLNDRLNHPPVAMQRISGRTETSVPKESQPNFGFPGHENVARVPSQLGEIPQGWELKKLHELAHIRGGRQLEKENIRETGNFPVFGGNGIQGYSDLATDHGFVIAFGRVGAYCGSIHWSYGGAWLNNNSSSVVPLKHDEWVLHSLLDFEFGNLRSGAAQPFISNGALSGIDLLFPGDGIAKKFCSLVRPLRLLQVTLGKVVQNLRKTRDLLLPRLVSGELDVSRSIEAEAIAV
jgi:type I restriction enzyme, S subunit